MFEFFISGRKEEIPDADERLLRVPGCRSSAPPVSRLVGGPPLSVCRNASVDGFGLFQRLRLSKNQSILPGGDRRTAAGRSRMFFVCERIMPSGQARSDLGGLKNLTGNMTKSAENVVKRCVSVSSAFSEKVAGWI